jgi:hypothetical protein
MPRGKTCPVILMAESKPVSNTFHHVREQCERGDANAWRAFLTMYSPLGTHLLAMYAPDPSVAPSVWKKTLESLAENQFERFRGTARQTEREFLFDVRALLLETLSREAVAPAAAPEGAGSATLSPESLAKLFEGLPLLHQEMIFFKLAGYGDRSIENMLRTAPRIAEKSFERLSPDYAAAVKIEKDRCPWPSEWMSVLAHARASATKDCPALHQILRIHDGQVSWYDKEPVEKHVSACLSCLERWTALREVGYWRKAAPPVATAPIEDCLAVLGLRAEEPKKSFLQRVFG